MIQRTFWAIRVKKGLFGLVVLSLLVAVLTIRSQILFENASTVSGSSKGGENEHNLDTLGADSLQSEGQEGGAVSTSQDLRVTSINRYSNEEHFGGRPPKKRELDGGEGTLLRASSEVTRKFLEALPPYFNLAFQPPSVSLIFNSYIGGAYAKFRDEVMMRGGEDGGVKERQREDLQSGIAAHPHAARFVEKSGEVQKKIDSYLAGWSGGRGVGTEDKSADKQEVESGGAQMLPPMLYPPMLPPFRYVGGLNFERTDIEAQTQAGGDESNSISSSSYALNTCIDLAKQDYREFATVVSRVDLYRYPLYNMPWHFHDPSPLCGRYMLRYLENTPQPKRSTANDAAAATALNPVPSEYIYGKYGETDRTPLPAAGSLAHYPPPLSPSLLGIVDSAAGSGGSSSSRRPASGFDDSRFFSQRHLHRLALFPPVTATITADTGSSPSSPSPVDTLNFSITQQGLASIKVLAGQAVFHRIGLETCGGGGLDDDIFIVARLIGKDRVIAVDSVAASHAARQSVNVDSRMRNVLRYFNFLAPDVPGKYVFEAKYVHFNGSSTSNKEPRTLGVIGIRANDKGKSFKYNTICDMQRHLYGSPLEVEVVAEDSNKGNEGNKGVQNGAATVQMNVRSEGKAASVDNLPPICTTANHTHGMWVRVRKEDCNTVAGSTFCRGDPTWLSDAAGFNTGLMWVPFVFSSGNAVESDVHTLLSDLGAGGKESSQIDDHSEVLKVIPRSSPPHQASFIVNPNVFFVGGFNGSTSSALLSSSIVKEGVSTQPVVVATIPCRFHVNSPPGGPSSSCLRIRENNKSPYTKGGTRFGASFTIVGDSVMREYAKNCALFNLRAGRIVCVFNNIVLEGQHYSKDYAKAVAVNIIQAATRNKAAFFATNLGIHHMVGPCTTQQWVEFVDIFAELWKKAVGGISKPRKDGGDLPAEFYLADAQELAAGEVLDRSSPAHAENNLGLQEGAGNDNKVEAVVHKNYFVMEKAIWIGPPSVHYARRGMSLQRASIWDQLAWERLEPLGFQRLNAVAPTLSRQESTWDGLHYAAERGKVQTPLRDRKSQVRQWNGGVSAMLFSMLLSMICTV